MTVSRAFPCRSVLNCWQCAGSCHLYKVLLLLIFRWLSATQVSAWDSVTVRLTGGSVPWEGLVEVFYEGIWGSVCDDFWDENDGRVVCRQLGYKSVVKVTTGESGDQPFGTSIRPIILDNVRCDGDEENLGECIGIYGILAHDCTQVESAGVICEGLRSPVQGSVRLADAGASWRGNVEVFYDGEWGTVCDNTFDMNAGDVVCRQLGFPGARNIYDGSKFGWGAGNTLLFDVSCSGIESQLLNCGGTWGAYSSLCYKTENAGVACNAESGAPNISLAGGAYPNQGLVQIFLNERWGTVCDNNWGIEEASVVCRQLGYETVVETVINSGFGSGQGDILLEDIRCYGEEISIYFCDHNGVGTTNSYDCGYYGEENTAGVVCKSDIYPNHVVLPSGGHSSDAVIEAVIGTIVPVGVFIVCCWCCCRVCCRNNNKQSNEQQTTVVQQQQPAQGSLYTPVPTAPPPAGHPSAVGPTSAAVYPPPAGPPTAPYHPSAGPPSAPYPASAGPPSAPYPASAGPPSAPYAPSSGHPSAPYPASTGAPLAPYPPSTGPPSAPYAPSAGPPSAPYPPSAPAYPPSATAQPGASYPTGVIPPPVASGYELPPPSYPQAAPQAATTPSAPDLPPQYDSVVADPSKYGLQPEPPAPAYTEPAVVFNPATQSVDVEKSYSTTA